MLTVTSGRASPSILAEIVGQYGDSRVPAYSSIEPQLIRSYCSIVVNKIVGVLVTGNSSKLDYTSDNTRLLLLGAIPLLPVQFASDRCPAAALPLPSPAGAQCVPGRVDGSVSSRNSDRGVEPDAV